MTEPLPCPFCGHVGLSQYEGSTFRWLATECNGCGAQCGEERIDTMTMERSAAIEQAKVAAIETWNTRAAQPEQQAEPVQEPTPWRDMIVVTLAREGINKHRARELADHFAAQPVQEPVGEVVEVNNDGFKCEFSQHLPVGTKLYTTPPQQQAEPVVWDKPSASFNEWWDSYRHDGGNPFQTDSFAYWAFAGWKAALAQRQWVGLNDVDVKNLELTSATSSDVRNRRRTHE